MSFLDKFNKNLIDFSVRAVGWIQATQKKQKDAERLEHIVKQKKSATFRMTKFILNQRIEGMCFTHLVV